MYQSPDHRPDPIKKLKRLYRLHLVDDARTEKKSQVNIDFLRRCVGNPEVVNSVSTHSTGALG